MEDPPLGVVGRADDSDGGDTVGLEGNSLLESFRLIRESAPQLQASGITVEVLAGILAAAPTATGGTFGELLHVDGITSMAGSLLTVDASVLDPVLTGTIRSLLDLDEPFDTTLDIDRFRYAGQALPAKETQERVHGRRPGRSRSGDHTILDRDPAHGAGVIVGLGHDGTLAAPSRLAGSSSRPG